MLLKRELRKIEIRNKDLYMMKNQNNTWVDTNLRNYKNKDLENDFILLSITINFLIFDIFKLILK